MDNYVRALMLNDVGELNFEQIAHAVERTYLGADYHGYAEEDLVRRHAEGPINSGRLHS